MASITLNGIRKSFGDNEVLRTLDLEIRDGEFLTLVGPSGCGKSTLLRIIAGLEAQSAGDVLIDGRIVNDVRPSRRDLAMVFQSYALYPHLTVAENMLTPLKLRDLGFAERLPILGPLMARSKYRELYAQVREAADTLRIGDLLNRKPGQLPGGQRQRAAPGRAMVSKAVAFLLDKPLSNLDAAHRLPMRPELGELYLA
ncbi:MAG: ABC transporter ATP-binding protein, partial [Thiotrichales bacterium]|nr:ABC transporter ATP-binding protein [Thiotrichales bacterium]